MKKFYIFIAAFVFVNAASSQIINYPDANLKAKLLSAQAGNNIAYGSGINSITLDVNGDGEIEVAEAALVERLHIGYANITDMSGIENFINLTYLDCSHNQLTSFDATPLQNLTGLDVNGNVLTTFSITGLPNLTSVNCAANQLSSFALLGLPVLNSFVCAGNQLTSIDLNGAPLLHGLYCNNNQLTTIDLAPTQVTLLDARLNNLNTLYLKNGVPGSASFYFEESVYTVHLRRFGRCCECQPETA